MGGLGVKAVSGYLGGVRSFAPVLTELSTVRGAVPQTLNPKPPTKTLNPKALT